MIERFLDHWQTINRHIRAGALQEGSPITRVQWMILRHIRNRGACSIGHLAEHFGVRASTVSQMLDRLERMDYVERKPDERDARVKLARLTEQGRGLIREVEEVWMNRLAGPFGTFTPDERRQLIGLLERLAASIGDQAVKDN